MKRYTQDEANELLPYLAPTLIELRDKSMRARAIRKELELAAVTNGGSEKRTRWTRTLARVDELMERLRGWEIEVRDLESGLVDFPATVDGQDAFLCWKLGEPKVAHWHPRGEGFASRRPL